MQQQQMQQRPLTPDELDETSDQQRPTAPDALETSGQPALDERESSERQQERDATAEGSAAVAATAGSGSGSSCGSVGNALRGGGALAAAVESAAVQEDDEYSSDESENETGAWGLNESTVALIETEVEDNAGAESENEEEASTEATILPLSP
jgi:hypothetical protein